MIKWDTEPQPNELRMLLVAPTRRDAEVTRQILETAGVECVICNSLPDLVGELKAGAGALMLTDLSLTDPAMAAVEAALRQQPPWSDLPTVLLTRDREQSPRAARALAALTNVTLLDRPSSTRSMVSAVHFALRARRKQYQIRDHLLQQGVAQAALRDADTRKDQFLATLAHELRNPLAAISNAVYVLKEGPAAEPSPKIVAMIERQSRLLVRLIDDLLDVTRIATGKVVLQRERLDMRAIVSAAVEFGEPTLRSFHHQVEMDLPPGPVWLVGDSSRLTQVISNLLNNAAKYTRDGGCIKVKLSKDADHCTVLVRDNGVGIPRDMLDQVFDMFTQVNRTIDRSQGGLGIGLSLVRQLIQLHGGTVVAHSEGIDRGSCFTIQLPLATPRDAESAEPRSISPSREASTTLRILVVDDNQDVANALAALLARDGHQTRTEYSGWAGLTAAEEFNPQVVFCDIGMPGLDGHQVAARLRSDERYASTLLVAITGWGTEDHKRRTRDAGFDVHLTKPVDEAALKDILARL